MSPHRPGLTVHANEDGTSEFSAVPPGSYILHSRGHSNDKNSKLTYFPGTTDGVAAVRIEVGSATEHNGFDFVVAND